jgi:hypothetical protein
VTADSRLAEVTDAATYAGGCLRRCRMAAMSAPAMIRAGETARAQSMLREADSIALRGLSALAEAGIEPATIDAQGEARRGAQTSGPLSLSRLAALDSPEARELLAELRRLLPLAELVDARRGDVLPQSMRAGALSRGETVGIGHAETIGNAICVLSRELEPMNGRE